MEEFENSQPAVGLIFHIFSYLLKEYKAPDLLIRSFYVKMNIDELAKEKETYFLIKDITKVSSFY